MYNVIFAGSGNFAVPILTRLVKIANVSLVITRPARPAGKGHKLQSTPVYEQAKKINLQVETPKKIEDLNSKIANIKPTLIVVTDYGALISQSTLDLPELGVINVHPSLLPKYRGPSPIQASLLNGDTTTGVSVMLIDDKMDHGPILAQTEYIIPDNMTAVELEKELSELGAKLLVKTIPEYIEGRIKPISQNHKEATFCKLINKTAGIITNKDSIDTVCRKVKALQPWPGTWFTHMINDKQIRVAITRTGEKSYHPRPESEPILHHTGRKLYLSVADGDIEVLELKPEAKRVMNATDFINGYFA